LRNLRDIAWGKLVQVLSLLSFEGASLGLALWALTHGPNVSVHVMSNGLDAKLRWRPLEFGLSGAVLATVLGLVAVLFAPHSVDWVQQVVRRLCPTLVFWALPVLWDYRVWHHHDVPFLLLLAAVLACLQPLLRIFFSTPPLLPNPPSLARVRRWLLTARKLPFFIVLLAVAGYAWFFSYYTIRNHYRLGSASFDLGIENNLVWNAVHWGPLFKTSPLGGPKATHLGFHQTYFAYVLGLFYRLAPGPQNLLVAQAVLMGAAAIPLYLIARHELGRWLGCFVGVLYVFYPPLHGAALYDFHYLPLATFFLWLTLYLTIAGRFIWAGLAVLLTLSVREDVSALLVVIGAFLTLRGERPVAGLVLSIVGAAYFVGVKMILMPRFLAGGEAYIHQYAGLLPQGDSGFGGVLKTVVGNPGFTMASLLERDKLIYFLKIAAPLAFFPWRRPIGLLCAVPGFFFTLLATKYPPLIQTSFQYTTYWTAFLFLAVIANVAWFDSECRRSPERTPELVASKKAWLVTLAVSMLLMTHQFGALLQQNTVIGGFGPYRFDLTVADRLRHDRLYRLIAKIPPDAKVVSSEMIVPQISNRANSYTLRTGVHDAEYALMWLPVGGLEVAPAIAAIKGGTFGVIEVSGEFLLAKRGYPTDKNAEIVARYRW
jgi:uncharacterized membrane protein